MERANYYAPFPVYDTDIINDLKEYDMITKQDNYNNVPVDYCKTCLSLKIKDIKNPSQGFCISCGNTSIGKIHIEEWEDKYVERYGVKFLDQEVTK